MAPAFQSVPARVRNTSTESDMKHSMDRSEKARERDYTQGAEMIESSHWNCGTCPQMVPKYWSGAENQQYRYAEQCVAPVGPFARRERRSSPGRVQSPENHSCSRNFRRTSLPSSASCSGSRSASTSTSDAATASGPSERIPSTTRREARDMNSSFPRRAR